jgi:hypothetical protein
VLRVAEELHGEVLMLSVDIDIGEKGDRVLVTLTDRSIHYAECLGQTGDSRGRSYKLDDGRVFYQNGGGCAHCGAGLGLFAAQKVAR